MRASASFSWPLSALRSRMIALGACAGRAPQPVAIVQPQDQFSDCAAISAEVQANNNRISELASEKGLKVGQNVAEGSPGYLYQCFGLVWIGKVQPALKKPRCKVASNILRAWLCNVVPQPCRRRPVAISSRRCLNGSTAMPGDISFARQPKTPVHCDSIDGILGGTLPPRGVR
jgi:hypothetical protein